MALGSCVPSPQRPAPYGLCSGCRCHSRGARGAKERFGIRLESQILLSGPGVASAKVVHLSQLGSLRTMRALLLATVLFYTFSV
jgi:hypothetical protein